MNNARTTLLLALAILAAAPCASSQSFGGLLKKAAEAAGQKAKEQIIQEVGEAVQQQTQGKSKSSSSKKKSSSSGKTSARDREIEKQAEAMLGPDGNRNIEDDSPTVRLPETHSALLAPVGYPVPAEYGTRSVKPSMPPAKADAQVSWRENQPRANTLDNQSLVDEYVLLLGLVEDGYIVNLTPAHWRYIEEVLPELGARANALNGMVEKMAEIRSEYAMTDTYNWVINGYHADLTNILSSDAYKTVIRSSLEPIFALDGFITEDTRKYFEAHGGFKDAINEDLTGWTPTPDKASVTTSVPGQTGTVEDENASGGTVDIGGVVYVLHNGKKAGSEHAFISEAVKVAVDGKDVVIPDYINFGGRKYAVTEMRADLFSYSAIKSVKLPSTLIEISNAAFRGTPIREITIPASVKRIQGSAFQDCANLAKVTFEGESMEELHGCFQRCTSLRSIKLPQRVGLMSYSMFEGCSALSEVQLPENLTEIYQNMFRDCKSLKNLDVPASVTKVGSLAFSGCGVTSLDLSNVKEFDSFCFNGCNSLATVKLNAALKENFLTETYSEVFMQCPLLQVKYVNNEYIIPKGFIFVE